MKAAVKKLGLRFLTVGPVYGALRLRALRGNPATILCYHTLRPQAESLDAWIALGVDDFREQISMLHKSYDIVPLDTVLDPVAKGARPRVALTFDDGEVGLYSHLLPIVIAEDLPVTIYVATQQIETGKAYWFDQVMNALQGAGVTRITLEEHGSWQVGPDQGKARWAQISAILETLKQTPAAVRDELADMIVTQAGDAAPHFSPLQPMTLAQLQEMANNPNVTIGAHSHGHELLDQLPLSAARDSISRSRDLLKKWTNQSVDHFAYPNGNYTTGLMEVIGELGFATATVLGDKLAYRNSPAKALPRIGVGRYDKIARFRLRLVGV